MWSDGNFKKPDLKEVSTHFLHHKWGNHVNAYIHSLQQKTNDAWCKMLIHTYEVMESNNPNNKLIPYSQAQAQAQAEAQSSTGHLLGRVMCVDEDSE